MISNHVAGVEIAGTYLGLRGNPNLIGLLGVVGLWSKKNTGFGGLSRYKKSLFTLDLKTQFETGHYEFTLTAHNQSLRF